MRLLLARFLSVLMLITAAAPAFASSNMAGAHAFGCDVMAMDHAGHEMPADSETDPAKLRLCPLAASCMAGVKTVPAPLRGAQIWVHAPFDAAHASTQTGNTFTLDPPPPRLS